MWLCMSPPIRIAWVVANRTGSELPDYHCGCHLAAGVRSAVRFEVVPGVVLPHRAGVLRLVGVGTPFCQFGQFDRNLAGAVELPPLRQARQ
jgi:hypothetical protein